MSGCNVIIETLFPELKGGEDEITRKELIDFVKSRLAGFPDCKRFTDWLEKQKPVEKVWHDANNEQPKQGSTVVVWNNISERGEVLRNVVKVNFDWIWAYIEDLLPKTTEK